MKKDSPFLIESNPVSPGSEFDNVLKLVARPIITYNL